jgi:TRAP-type C4-dicarboxylate transport system permease small subunit
VFHHWNGRCILLLALAQIIAGYFELGVFVALFFACVTEMLGVPKWAYGIWLPFLGAFVFISLVLEVWKLFRPHHDKLDIHYVL